MVAIRHFLIGAFLLGGLIAAPVALGHPGCGIIVDNGDVYFADTGHGIWKINKDGKATSYCGPARHCLAIDRRGQFQQKEFAQLSDPDVTVFGPKPNLLIGLPMAVGSDGAFYYAQKAVTGRVEMMRMAHGEKPKRFAALPVAREISYEGKEIEAEWVWYLAAGPNGSIYYTEKRAVRKIAADGTVSTVAENVVVPGCEHPPAVTVSHADPGLYGLDVAADGTVYVAASTCSALLKFTPDGTMTVPLRATGDWSPTGVAVAGDTLYVLEYTYIQTDDRKDWMPRVRKVAPDGAVTIVAQISKDDRAAADKLAQNSGR